MAHQLLFITPLAALSPHPTSPSPFTCALSASASSFTPASSVKCPPTRVASSKREGRRQRRQQPVASYQYGAAASGGGDRSENESEGASGMPNFKFDPESDTNAFGRDPKKETEFWRQSARDLLASDEVRSAIDEFMASGADNLTEERRAYNNFLKKMDADSGSSGDATPSNSDEETH